ncbi:outer membrane protein assembly factor [Pseudotenacibaculum haliotis]|uniref:Outer membrane protein assembly factor n=1 Tax=Pseudotenacibaculum haliotis TaxID=1862138 RepID=A0ABW5LQ80_9FLAO
MKRIVLVIIFILGTVTTYCQEGIIYDIKIRGAKKTKAPFIKQILESKAGKPLDSVKLKNDIARLRRQPAISHAYFQVFYSHENLYNVYIDIEENFTIIPFANVYTTNDDEFAYRIGVNEFNFLGRGINIGGFFQKDIYNSYAINFRAPFLFGRKVGLAFNYQNLTTQEPVFFDDTTADYKYNNTSYELLGLYQFNFHHRVELGLNLFTEDYQYKSGATSPNVPQELVVDKSLIKLIYEYNALNYYYESVSGFRSIFNFQYVNARNQILPDFSIWWNDFFYYKRFGEKGNWANRLRIGFASNEDSPFAPFSVDNNLNVRGVGNIIDRGTGVVVLNTEYRYILHKKGNITVQGNAFIDAGSWRNPGGDLGDFSDSNNLRIYPGLGVRFIHKKIYNAIFRIDYGYGITKNGTQGFVFGIGQYF